MKSKPPTKIQVQPEPDFNRVLGLSACEHEVFTAFGRGLTAKETALLRGVSVKTIEAQAFMIKKKLQMQDMWKLRVFACRYVLFLEQQEVARVPILPDNREKFRFERRAA